MKKSAMYMLLMVGAIVPKVVVNGLVLRTLWGWFIYPKFASFTPNLTLCMGVATTFGMLVGMGQVSRKSEKNFDAIKLHFDVEKLSISTENKKQILALQACADRVVSASIKETLTG